MKKLGEIQKLVRFLKKQGVTEYSDETITIRFSGSTPVTTQKIDTVESIVDLTADLTGISADDQPNPLETIDEYNQVLFWSTPYGADTLDKHDNRIVPQLTGEKI